MSDNFRACVAITLTYEGGFSDNPAATSRIRRRSLRREALESFSLTFNDTIFSRLTLCLEARWDTPHTTAEV